MKAIDLISEVLIGKHIPEGKKEEAEEVKKTIAKDAEEISALEKEFEEANDNIINEHKKIAKKRVGFMFTRNYAVGDFIIDALYITYLVYKAAILHSLNYML